MQAIDTKKLSVDGYTVTINIHTDEHHGAPWKEEDGHGKVSEWTTRDKYAGERVLNSDGRSKRYYDFAGAIVKAKEEGWGLNDGERAKLEKRLGRKPTIKEVRAQAVELDFEHLRGWCNDEWGWLGYTTDIETPDGEKLDGDSCWGFEGTDDGTEYMVGEAETSARHFIKAHMETELETLAAQNWP